MYVVTFVLVFVYQDQKMSESEFSGRGAAEA
jgi:hypothetical protein